MVEVTPGQHCSSKNRHCSGHARVGRSRPLGEGISMSVCRDRKRKVPRARCNNFDLCLHSNANIPKVELANYFVEKTSLGFLSSVKQQRRLARPLWWPMRLIAFRISQHSASSHEEEELSRCCAAKVRSLICMGNGAFIRLLTVSQNDYDYIFHRLRDYRIASCWYVARRLIM
jgi:hypothetical protein